MIKVMVDSASDCRSREGIYDIFVPISVNIDGKEYFDGVDIDNDTFYDLLLGTKAFPSTSQPSPEAFIKHFERIRDDGDELIYFAISSALSGTYQGACIAKDMVGYDGIHIIDTITATHMIGVLAGYAKQLIAQGMSASEIVV
ncbi:MAG: DegV family EDD domain-containing protein [Clostridia bacterium]|nr:DegV family EDD domain-containing protein [Clostridia bacterium]